MRPDDFPDLTISEIKESDEYDTDDLNLKRSVKDEVDDYTDAMMILAATTALSKMVEDDELTLRRYMELMEYLEEWERDLDHSPLR